MSPKSSPKRSSRWFQFAASGLLAIQGAITTTVISEIAATTPGTILLRTAAAQDESSVAQRVYRKAAPAIVYIETNQGTGSGVIVESDGLIVTNAHVIKDAKKILVELQNGRQYGAEVVSMGSDNCLDLALLRIKATNLPKLNFAAPSSVQPGQQVFAIGYPLGIKPSSITQGIISNVYPQVGRVQTDTTLIPGNSGGALLNNRGELVAINTSKGMGDRTGMNFAFSVDKVQTLIQATRQGISPVIGQFMIPTTVSSGQALAQNLTIDGNAVNSRLQSSQNLMCADESYANLYTFEGKAYAPIMLEMRSPDVGSYMLLLGPNGELVAKSGTDERNEPALIIDELPVTGRYTVVVNSSKAIAAAQYQLQATTPLLVKSDRLDINTEPRLDNGAPFRSYRFVGKAGQEIAIALHQFEFDPYLIVMDMKGNVIAKGKTNRQDVIKVALPQDGSYRLVVTTVNPSEQGKFTLSVHTIPQTAKPNQISQNR